MPPLQSRSQQSHLHTKQIQSTCRGLPQYSHQISSAVTSKTLAPHGTCCRGAPTKAALGRRQQQAQAVRSRQRLRCGAPHLHRPSSVSKSVQRIQEAPQSLVQSTQQPSSCSEVAAILLHACILALS